MRAYLSDRGRREPSPVWAAEHGYQSPTAYVAERMILSAEAEREARGILAETEPQSGIGAYGGYAALDDLIDDEPAALAEALAAFVKEV